MSTPIPIGRKAVEAAQDRGVAGGPAGLKVCIVGASGKLGRYMVQHALDRGYEVVAVCRDVSVDKLEEFSGRITIIPGATDDREVIERAVAGCDGVLTVLVPRGVHHYSTGTAAAVLDHARPGARLVFSCGYHITRDGQDVYSWKVKVLIHVAGRSRECSVWLISTTRWRRAEGSSPATHGGLSCAAATWRRASHRACRCGADTWETRSSRATSHVVWTSPGSWWRPSRTTSWFMRRRRLSAARRHRHSPTPPTVRPHLR